MPQIEEEVYTFEYLELKALIYIAVTRGTLFVAFEACNFQNANLAKKYLENEIDKTICDALSRKIEKGEILKDEFQAGMN